jgi:hypothetical protein
LSTGYYGFKLLAAKKKLLAQQVEISNLNCHEKASLQQNPKQHDRMQNLCDQAVIPGEFQDSSGVSTKRSDFCV